MLCLGNTGCKTNGDICDGVHVGVFIQVSAIGNSLISVDE